MKHRVVTIGDLSWLMSQILGVAAYEKSILPDNSTPWHWSMNHMLCTQSWKFTYDLKSQKSFKTKNVMWHSEDAIRVNGSTDAILVSERIGSMRSR